MDKHPIDQLFRNQLSDFQKSPRPASWDKLEALLDEEEGAVPIRRRIIPLYGWWSAAASVSFLLILSWVLWQPKGPDSASFQSNQGNQPSQSITKTDSSDQKLNQLPESIPQEFATQDKEEGPGKEQQNLISPKNSIEYNQNKKQELSKQRPSLVQKDIKSFSPKDELPEIPLVKEENDKALANHQPNEPGSTYKIVVKVKLGSKTKQPEIPILAQETGKNNSKRKLARAKSRKRKNSEDPLADESLKRFKLDPEKVLVFLGK